MPKISNYTQVSASKLADKLVCDQEDSGVTSTKSVSIEQIGNAVNALQVRTDLDTQAQTIVSAINEIVSYTPVYNNTANGSIATFDTSLALPLQDCTIAINAVQEGTGTPSPQNVRNLVGFTGANIGYCDFNQLRRDDTTTNTADGITTEYNSTTHLVSITNNSRTTNYSSGSTQITLSTTAPIENHVYAYLANTDEQGISISQTSGSALRQTDLINTVIKGVSGATGFRLRVTNLYDFVSAHPINNTFSFYLNIIDLTQAFGEYLAEYLYSLTDHGISIVKQIFTKDYYAYDAGGTKVSIASVNGTPYPNASVTWQSEADTVYGGSLDVTSGVLTVTHKGYTFTGSSDENWSVNLTQTDNYYYRINIPELLKANTAIANMYPYAPIGTNNTVQGINSAVAGTGGQFRIRYGTEMSISDWKTFLSNNNLIAIAELDTPQTYQLTPTQISAIVGTNNVFTDTNGNTSVVFACSLKDYIDSQ